MPDDKSQSQDISYANLKADALKHYGDDLTVLAEAGVAAGALARSFFQGSYKKWTKGTSSPVTEADLAVDQLLRDRLGLARPHYGWLSEETADNPDRLKRERVFIIDPIDGTRGFVEGKTNWTVSLAIVEKGRPIVGVLYAPMLDELFLALADGGATLNGARLHAGQHDDLKDCTIFCPKDILKTHKHFPFKRGPWVPSLAYRIAMIAADRLDGTVVRKGSHDWDLAAADLILQQSGGALIDENGHPPLYNAPTPRHSILAASGSNLLKNLTAWLNPQPDRHSK